MLKRVLAPFENKCYALLRIVTGLMFSFHGMQKMFGVLGKAVKFGDNPQAWIGGVIELATGLAIALGLFTRWAAFIASGMMAVAYWQFHVDFTTPANTTLTGPANLATAAFTQPCGGTGGTCVPQSGTNQQLDTLGDRIMYRLAYRNFGDHEALVVNRSVTAGSSVGIRWYELRTGTGNSLSIF